MLPDPLWPYILAGAVLFLAGALLSAAIGPFGRALNRLCNAFLRITRIKPDAGLQSVSEDELRALMDLSEEKGSIEADEKEMIENVFDFNDTVAEDVMVHRTDMVMLWTGDTDEEIVQTIEDSGLSRFPVYEEDADDIVGILSTRDYLLNARRASPKPLKELLRAAYFIPESVRADVLFRDMQSKKVHMAIVVDEYGGTSGLVTMEDLLETIVGDLDDEHEDDNAVVTLADGVYEVGGDVPVNELEGLLGEDIFENADCDTIGGFITETLGRIPQAGETLPLETLGYTLTVAEATPRAVTKVTITRTAEKTADPQPAPEQKRRFGRKKDRDGEK